MDSKEARIGNWLLDGVRNPFQVTSIGKTYFGAQGSRQIAYKKVSPIPLTDDILLKAGFETDTICFYRNNFTLGSFVNDDFIYLPTGQLHIQSVHVKHLHQLQNLYYSLTEEELIINL